MNTAWKLQILTGDAEWLGLKSSGPPRLPSPPAPEAGMRGPKSNKGHGFGALDLLSLRPSSGTLGKSESHSCPSSVGAGLGTPDGCFCFPHWGCKAWMQQALGSRMVGAVGRLRSSGHGRVTCDFPSSGPALSVTICLPWPLPQSRSSKVRQRLVKDSGPHHLLPTHTTSSPFST